MDENIAPGSEPSFPDPTPPRAGVPPFVAPSPRARPGFAMRAAAPLLPSTKDERLWATFIHLGGVVGGWSTAFGIPGGNILVPLVLWLIKREGSAFLDDQGKEAVNFQITVTLAALVCFVLFFFCVGIPLMIALGIYALVIGILGAIKANEGVAYRYPATLRLLT